METNACNVNLLEVGNLLPPRKRLLAELKRQNSDVNSCAHSTCISSGTIYNSHHKDLLRSRLIDPDLVNEEIVETSRVAAIAAAKVADAARAIAEEKAAKAAKAVLAAKRALDLVDTLSEEAANGEKLKRNMSKKHLHVQALYTKNKENTYDRTDEELARELHHVINSSQRILKDSSGSDTKNRKHKRLKSVNVNGKTSIVKEGELPSMASSNSNGEVDLLHTEGSVKDINMTVETSKTSKLDKRDRLKLNNGERLPSKKNDQLKLEKFEVKQLSLNDKFVESRAGIVKRRDRMKQKKLPLSVCNFRDQTSSRQKFKYGGEPQLEGNIDHSSVSNKSLFSVAPSVGSLKPVEKSLTWKCQAFKATASVKQN